MRARRLLLGLLGVPLRLAAQGDCFPGADSREAKAMALVSLPLAFTQEAAPTADAAKGIWLGLEVSRVPRVSDRDATPTICRPGKGPEHANLLPVVPRPRIIAALGHGVEVEASWIPPLRVAGVRANLFSLAVSKAVALTPGGVALAVRVHGVFGLIQAAITCDEEALGDATSECFGGQRSDDEFRPNQFGAELALGWPLGQGRWRPYGGVGYNRLAPRFRVNFTNALGETDRRRVEVNLSRVVGFAGLSWRALSGLELSGELYAAPADAVTGRFVVRAAL